MKDTVIKMVPSENKSHLESLVHLEETEFMSPKASQFEKKIHRATFDNALSLGFMLEKDHSSSDEEEYGEELM